jgi:Spy/CpxP family protein refolding chaperone
MMRYLFPGFFAGLITLTLALLLSTAAFARGYGPHDQQVMNFGQTQQVQFQQGQLLKGPEQRQALDAVYATHHKAISALSAKLHARQGELDALLADSTSSQEEINRAVEEINALNAALLKEQVAMRMELREQGLSHGPLTMMQEHGLGAAPFCNSPSSGGGMRSPQP